MARDGADTQQQYRNNHDKTQYVSYVRVTCGVRVCVRVVAETRVKRANYTRTRAHMATGATHCGTKRPGQPGGSVL